MKNKRKNILLTMTPILLSLFSGIPHETAIQEDIGKTIYARPFETMQSPYSYSNKVTDEPMYSSQYHLNHLNIGNTWDNYRGENVTVAVIDSGINYQHVDFFDANGKSIISELSGVYDESAGPSNYYVKSVKNSNMDYSIIDDDEDGHGTNVAATIAAAVNNVGTSGIAPNVDLMFLKTDFTFTSIKYLIKYAVANGADIINMSIGAYVNSFSYEYNGKTYEEEGYGEIVATYFEDVMKYAHDNDVVLIAAAGNENTYEKSYPANNSYVIGVGALARNSSTSIASYSNHGTNVDVVAPGSVYVSGVGSSTSYIETQGTSFSSPATAACVALLKSKYPNMSADRIERRLKDTAYDLGTAGKDDIYGYGRVDVTNLLSIPVDSVSLSDSLINLKLGATYQLTATVSPSNAANKEVIFISNDESIATVDESTGLVTATGIGSTKIGVLTDDGGFEAYCDVIVTSDGEIPVSSISLNKTSLDLRVGSSETLTATYSPSYATNVNLTWSSSNSSVASVNNGVVTAKGNGTATITVSANGKSATCLVSVTDGKVKEISIDPTNKTIGLNETVQFTATVLPNDADNKNITWSSSDPSVASINEDTGLLTSLGYGSTTITATAKDGSNISNSTTLTVSPVIIEYKYQKVTSELADYSGQYIFVYENGNKVMNGNLESIDVTNNVLSNIPITNETIEATSAINDASFTISSLSNGNYAIKNKLNKYIYNSGSKNKLEVSDTAQPNTISLSDGNVIIQSNSKTLTYNTASDQNRFRYMSNVNGAIQLYKYAEVSTVAITGLTYTGTLQKTIYNNGDTFDPTGLTIYVEYGDGSKTDVTSQIVWSPSTLSIFDTYVTGTYTYNNQDYTIDIDGIIVDEINVDLIDITFDNQSLDMTINSTQQLNVNFNPINASDKELNYVSSNPNVASISNSGLISATSIGRTKITATSKNHPNISTSLILTVKSKNTSSEVKWELVSDVSTLESGDEIVLAVPSKNVVAGSLSGTYLSSINATFANDKSSLTLPSEALTFTLGGGEDNWTLSNNNQLLGSTDKKKVAFESGTTTWSISIENNNATISNSDTKCGEILYNSDSPRFTTYTSGATDKMLRPSIYRKTGGNDSPLEQLIAAIAYADTNKDYINVNDYLNAFEALSSDDQVTFKETMIEDVDGSINAYEKLHNMKDLYDAYNPPEPTPGPDDDSSTIVPEPPTSDTPSSSDIPSSNDTTSNNDTLSTNQPSSNEETSSSNSQNNNTSSKSCGKSSSNILILMSILSLLGVIIMKKK